MDKHEKEKLSRYGKLVWDFANGKTTDDVLTSFFENLQVAFNFSKDFLEKALTFFPTKQMTIGSLSSKEQNLFEILLNRNQIFKSCNDTLHSGWYNIEKYDPIKFMFTISERNWISPRNDNDPDYTDETILIPEKEIDKCINTFALDDDWKKDLKAELKTLAKLHNQIEEIKSATTNRFAELEKIAEAYPEISKLHDHIKVTQEKLKHILSEIIEADNAYESKGFESMLSRYNSIHKNIYVVDDNRQLIEISAFIENHFYKNLTVVDYTYLFNAPISYCFIEYLKNPEYSGEERIAVCPNCSCIFSKSRLNDRQIFCPICSRKNKMTPEERAKYMKDYRANPARKRIVAKRKREAKIRDYINNAGKTREEAEIIVDEDM